MKYVLLALIVVGTIFGGSRFFEIKKRDALFQEQSLENPDIVIGYVNKNISELSPEEEVHGGKFYVTNITVDSGVGTVEYEDGHNAYVAQFSYSFSEDGKVQIFGFELVE